MTVVMAGCGDLGTEIGLRFAATGRRVLGLRRSPERLPAPFTGQAVDLATERPVLPADTETVVVALTADKRTAEGYRTTYVNGLNHVLEAIERAGVRPGVLLVSSTAVYGVSDGSWVDEDTPTEPSSDTGHVLLEAEQVLHENVPQATSVRLSGIYGPGRGALIDQVRSGTAVIPGTPSYTNRIHRDDAAAAVVHLATAVPAPGPVYVGVDDAPADRAEILPFLAHELGVASPPVSTSATARTGNKRCSNGLLRASGFEFTYPTYREGYRALLAGHGIRHP